MPPKFKDHFSNNSADYSSFRPSYPKELFVYLKSLSKSHDRAWDCATGSGQAAVILAEHYAEVIATDGSKCQIANATPKPNITYQVAQAEQSGIERDSLDLITVAQALHWFNQQAFANEVQRLLKNDGLLAVWSYQLFSVNEDIDQIINRLYGNTLDTYWPPERMIVEREYQDISFPDLTELTPPAFEMDVTWSFTQLMGYLSTWSAVSRFIKENGTNPLEEIYPQLLAAWGNETDKKIINWPMVVKIWQKID